MKVILISNVANGKVGDVVEVKDGYARNFLFPANKAIHYSKINYKFFETQKEEFEDKNSKLQSKAIKDKDIINNKEIIIIENASDDGRLYGAVNSGIILEKINEISEGLTITKSDIILGKPIKNTGVYHIGVKLFSDVIAKLNLVIARNESEIDAVKKQAKIQARDLSDDSENIITTSTEVKVEEAIA